LLLALRILDSLIDGENSAGSLGGGANNVDAHKFRLPHKLFVHVSNAIVNHVDSEPGAVLGVLRVLLSKLVEDVGRVHT
jgi:hypothetical protein